jgi:hypothetical protein
VDVQYHAVAAAHRVVDFGDASSVRSTVSVKRCVAVLWVNGAWVKVNMQVNSLRLTDLGNR